MRAFWEMAKVIRVVVIGLGIPVGAEVLEVSFDGSKASMALMKVSYCLFFFSSPY